jgi:putative Holliday junction resolvase
MRILALDVGDRHVGVALSDETATLASGLPNVERRGPRQEVKAVAALVRGHGVDEVVVGLPRRLDGTVGRQAEKVLAFVAALKPSVRVPIVTWDERFTTVMAHQAMIEGGLSRKDRKARVDQVSAVLILQNYLDYKKLAAAEAKP